jgi:hypothetical protein
MEIIYFPITIIYLLMATTKLGKVYYVPGSISSILLPFVFIFFVNRQVNQTQHFGSIPLQFPDESFVNNGEIFKDSFPPKRKYTDIIFTGNEKDDKVKLQFAHIQTREILSSADTSIGIHFLFTDSSNYQTFIIALDNLRAEKAKYYFPVENDIWFFYERPGLNTNVLEFTPFCGTEPVEEKISWSTRTLENIHRVWKNSREIILLYVLFLGLIVRFGTCSSLKEG